MRMDYNVLTRAACHSSSFPPTTAPLQTLHKDVWGPARVRGQGRERCFLLVVDDYSHYTTVFLLRNKGEVPDVLIPWIRAVRLQLRERFDTKLPVLRLHSDGGGEFSSDLLRDFCRGEGIRQTFTLPASPQQNGVAERRIGLVMEVARTSMIHAAAPHFLWPFATGEVGDVSVFRVWGSRAYAHDTSADKLSSLAIPCDFLGFPPDAPGCQFYHPTSRRVLPSQDVMFDESVPFYRLFPYRTAPFPPPHRSSSHQTLSSLSRQLSTLVLLGVLLLGVLSLRVWDLGVLSLSGGAELGVAESEGAQPGGVELERAEPGDGEHGGAEPWGAEPRGAEPEGAEPGGAESGGAEPERAEPGGALSARGPTGVSSRQEPLSPPQLREWFARRWSLRSGTAGAREPAAGGPEAGGATGAGAAGGAARARAAGGARAAGPGGARTGGTRAVGAGGPGAAGAGGATSVGAGDPGAGGAGPGGTGAVGAGSKGTVRLRPYFVPLLQQVLGLPPSTGLTPPLLSPPPDQSQPQLQPASPLPAPSPYTEQPGGLTKCREPASRPASPVRVVCTGRRVPLAELVDFAAAYRLDYAASLVAESESVCPPSVGGECALSTDVLEDRQEDFECFAAAVPHLVSMLITPEGDPDAPDIPTPRSYAEAIEGPYSSQWQSAMDAEMASWKSTGTYIVDVPPPWANIVSAMWIFRVKRPQGSPPFFKARYVARGLSQRQGVDFFLTFSPTPKITTLRVLLHVAAQLHSLDFTTAFLQASLHEEIGSCRPPGFTGLFPAGTQWSLRRPVYGLRQAPRKWHDTLRTMLAALGFAPSTADPSLFLRTDTSLPPFYILVYVDDLVSATADTKGLALVKLELQKRPEQVVSLDFINRLPLTARGHVAILIIIDEFSKMGHFIPTNVTATNEVKPLLR
ncbi:unnamed protein product [Closterium sp. NIES-53]